MENLKQDLDNLNQKIHNLEMEIQTAKTEAENNILPLKEELIKIKEEKRNFASKNDFESVQGCRRRENNIKFKIDAQWNRYSLLNEELSGLKKEKQALEDKIKLEEDKLKRKNQITHQMNTVLKNYRKSQNLKDAAIDSNINPSHVNQWYEWGKEQLDETYTYFYNQIQEIDNYFRDLKTQELKNQMDSVIEAYKKTNSLNKASEIAHVSYDTVQYWIEWGSKGFGAENTYFYNKYKNLN